MDGQQPRNRRIDYRLVAAVAAVSIGALVVLAVVVLGGSDDTAGANDLQIVARNSRFPDKVSAQAGTLGVALRNRDSYRHTFVIEGQGVKSDLPGRESRRLEVTLGPGTYRFFCDIPGHENMAGTIEVLQGG
jgi:plastocyanin